MQCHSAHDHDDTNCVQMVIVKITTGMYIILTVVTSTIECTRHNIDSYPVSETLLLVGMLQITKFVCTLVCSGHTHDSGAVLRATSYQHCLAW